MRLSVPWFTVAVFLLIVFIESTAGYSGLPGTRQSGVFQTDPPTPYFHYSNKSKPLSRVLVVHGLGGNKEMLNPLCYSLADAGIEVFSIDLPGHGESTASFNGMSAASVVSQVLSQLGPDTNVLGHSFGAALLLDVMNTRRVRSMVLFSPAPTTVESVNADRVLMFEGQLDLLQVRKFAPDLDRMLEGKVEFHELPWTDHTGALSDPKVMRQVAAWLGGDPDKVRPRMRSLLPLVMLASSLAFGIVLLELAKVPPGAGESRSLTANLIVFYIGGAALGAVLPLLVNVTGWLHLFAADYLMGFLLITGLVLCLACRRPRIELRTMSIGIAAAAYAIAIPGLLVLSKFTQMGLSGPRLLRFGAITLLGLPFFIADEILVRSIRPRWKSVFAMLLTRALLGAIIVTGVLEWSRDSGFLYFMMDSVVFFWIGLWFTGALIHRHTKEPVSTAVFMSLVQGWLFAALFVTK